MERSRQLVVSSQQLQSQAFLREEGGTHSVTEGAHGWYCQSIFYTTNNYDYFQ
ncbi:MAG: hypothetical protein IJF66_00935 [Clostridia bacterium]|nr:hypothetical protein [Clostridia bacterium]